MLTGMAKPLAKLVAVLMPMRFPTPMLFDHLAEARMSSPRQEEVG